MNRTDKFEKLAKVGDNFQVNMYDNGYMLEFDGTDTEGNYIKAKVVCTTLEDVIGVVIAACSMDKE
jgi:hypothetical protein